MRTIKFRAWHKKLLNMYSVEGLLYTADKNPELISVELPGQRYPDKCTYLKDIELMQFTGLLDKNGKEIYEGDVGQDVNDERYEIKFDDGFYVAVYGGNIINPLSEVAQDIEVIGNIYQNPELLK